MNKLSYVIEFVDNMDEAIKFYRDILGFSLKFQTPEWVEFSTGETTLALHSASLEHKAGSRQLGLRAENIDKFYQEMTAKGYKFTMPPTLQFGARLARFVDSRGIEYSVSGE